MAADFPLNIVIQTVDKATKGLDSVGGNIAKLGEKATKMGRSMTRNVTLPIVAIGAASVKAYADFETGMGNVATLIDTNTESLSDMGKRVQEIGRRTPVDLNDLTAGLYKVRSAGVSVEDQFTVLEGSARLAVAGLGTTEEAAHSVASALKAFQLEGTNAENVYDNLFTAVKHGNTTLSELSVGFGAVAGKMNDAGIEFDEYMAAVSAMTTTGLKAAQAHTQMRAAVDGLSKGSKPLNKIFKELGAKSFKELIQQSGGVVPAMAKIREVVGEGEGKMLKLVGSTEAAAAIMSVTGTTFEAYTETMADMRDGISEVDAGFDKQAKTTASRMKMMKNSLASVGIQIGEILIPVLEKLSEKLSAAIEWWHGLDQGTKNTIVKYTGIAAVIGPALMAFGKMATVIGTVTTALRKLYVFAAANPITALAAVIGIAALSIYENWEDFDAFFKLIWEKVVAVFEAAYEKIKPIIDAVKEGMGIIADAAAYAQGKQTRSDKFDEEVANNTIRINHQRRIWAAQAERMARENEAGRASDAEFDRKFAEADARARERIANNENKVTIVVENPGGAPVKVKQASGNRGVNLKTGPQVGGI